MIGSTTHRLDSLTASEGGLQTGVTALSDAEAEKHPFARRGLLRRIAPFALLALAAFALAPIVPSSEHDWRVIGFAAGVLVAIGLAVGLAPWRKLPSWVAALPPLAFLVVVALLRNDAGTEPSIYEGLAMLPAIWLALYGTPTQLITAVVGAMFVFVVPGAIEGVSGIWRSAFIVASAGLLLLIVELARSTHARAFSDERLRSVVQMMPEGLVVVDGDGRIAMSNRAARQLLSDATMRAQLVEPLGEVARGQQVVEQEMQIDGGPNAPDRWFAMSTMPLHDATGETIGGLALLHDISERKRDEQYRAAQYNVSRALAQAGTLDQALDALLEALGESLGWQLGAFWKMEIKPVMSRSIGRPVHTLRFDRAWSATAIDASEFEHRSEKLTLSSPLGLLGRVWESATPAWDLDLERSQSGRMRAVTDLGLNGSICLPVIAGDTVLGVVEFFAEQMSQPRGSLPGVLASIGSQIGEFIERKRAEQAADRDKDAFFGLVSHELRTPLTSIIGYVDLVLQDDEGKLDPDTRHYLEIARRNSTRLLRLVGDLLLIAQVQTGRFTHISTTVDLSAIAAASVEAARPAARAREVSLTYSGTPIPGFGGDGDRLSQLFDNLISNAIKFTPKGEQIEVRVTEGQDRVMCEVSNTGSYIPPEEGDHLFEHFYRGANATEQVAQGAGLGLAIAKAIVEVHGGKIRYESHEGVGTTFLFWLPLSRPEISRTTETSDAAAGAR